LNSTPDIILDKSAFIPFSTGPANCVGKSLAMVEMRYVIAMLIKSFDFELGEGVKNGEWERDLLDHYVMKKGRLPIKMSLRQH